VVAEKRGADEAERRAAWERYLAIARRATPDDRESIATATARIAALRDVR
jgi:hypothetical protein